MAESIQSQGCSGAAAGNAPLLITATASGDAQTIHTFEAGTTPGKFDELILYAWNEHSEGVTLNLIINDAPLSVPMLSKRGQVPVYIGRMQNGLIVKAWASVASVVYVQGYVHEITS